MKKLLYILLATSVVITACKKKNVSTSDAEVETKVEAEAKVNEDLILIQFSKSACFGKCPTYSVTITKDGIVDYNGVANMPFIGKKKFDMGSKFPAQILANAREINFFNLNDTYDNKYVTDIPSTSLMIETTERKHSTYARHEIPSELIGLNKYIHNEILEFTTKFKSMTKKPKVIEGIRTGELQQRPEKKVKY